MGINALEALSKITRAQLRGTLSPLLRVTNRGGSVIEVRDADQSHNVHNDLARQAELLAWVTKNWPGGEIRKDHGRPECRRATRARSRRKVYLDYFTYSAGPVEYTFQVEHECRQWKASTADPDASGFPVWHCQGCYRPMGVREARKRGLRP